MFSPELVNLKPSSRIASEKNLQERLSGTSVTRPRDVICEKQTNNKDVKTPGFQFLTLQVISRLVRDLLLLKISKKVVKQDCPAFLSSLAKSENTIILFICPPPPTFCIGIVSNFSWDLQWSQEK